MHIPWHGMDFGERVSPLRVNSKGQTFNGCSFACCIKKQNLMAMSFWLCLSFSAHLDFSSHLDRRSLFLPLILSLWKKKHEIYPSQ